MEIVESERNGVTILRFVGSMDLYRFPGLAARLEDIQERGLTRVVVHLGEITEITSRGVGAIVKLAQDVAGRGGRLVVAEPSPVAEQIIDLLQLRQFFAVCSTEEEAVAMFQAS